MRKNIFFAGVLAILTMTSCNSNSDQKEPVNTTTPPEQTTPPPAEKAAVPAAKKQEDGTTIKMNDQGVSIESKDGSKKSNVSLSKDSTRIEISRPK